MGPPTVHLVEAQALFVHELGQVLAEAGMQLRGVTKDLDARSLSMDPPNVVFVDTDYFESDPLSAINAFGALAPNAIVCVYTCEEDPEWADACHFAGATAVFSKRAPRAELVDGLLAALAGRRYTDRRLLR